MTKLNRLVSAVAAGSVILGAAASSVQAGDFRGRGYHGPRYVQPYHAPRQHYGYDNHRRHNGNKIAKGVAIGAAALILGTIIASEANRRHRY